MALLARYAARALEPREGAALEAHMRRLGILRAYALSGAYLADADTAGFRTQLSAERKQSLVRQENDFAAEMVRNADNRLALFASVNPNRSYSASELERCVAELGACGLKLHFWNSLVDVRQRTHLQRVKQVMEAADRHALSVMLHAFNGAVAGGFGPDDLEIVVRELVVPFRRTRVCFAHLGGAGNFGAREQALFHRLTQLLPRNTEAGARTFVDLSAVLLRRSDGGYLRPTTAQQAVVMGELLRAWGLDRVLWGSDDVDDYFEQATALWPLSSDDWLRLAAQTGSAFCPVPALGATLQATRTATPPPR